MAIKKESRRKFFQHVASASVGLSLAPSVFGAETTGADNTPVKPVNTPEWRNKQSGMSYRMFGNTGMMVSEIVVGTTPFNNDSFIKLLEAGHEKGINYIDTAPAYSKGMAEKVVGKYLKQSKRRNNVFLSTKISFYDEYVNSLVKDILNGLPQSKKSALEKKAEQIIEERGVLKPGYHFKYFSGQEKKIPTLYIRHLVLQEYGRMKEWKPKIHARAFELVQNSLTALQTDYLDVLHCPHGIAMPEELEDENIREILEDLKQKGITRFASCSAHNDVGAHLEKAIEMGFYDGMMVAYNIGNHSSLDRLTRKAKMAGMGLVAMKVARIVSNPRFEETPQWRRDKLNSAIPGDRSIQSKAYLWALQNPNISCCVSEMLTPDIIADNISVTGTKVELGKV